MKRELRYGAAALRRRPLLALIGWSLLELPTAALTGLAVARALDTGFLADRPLIGFAWLAGLLVASTVGAVGSRQVFARLGDLVEPLRDDLVRRVVADSLRSGAAGRHDEGALARLTRQVEIVRDTYAGLLVSARGFVIAIVGATLGLLALSPVIALLLLPLFLLGFLAFTATLGMSADRQRASLHADELLAITTGSVLSSTRDITACGAEEYVAAMVAGPVEAQASAERSLARIAALRSICFVIGGWLPLVVLLAAGPTLMRHGLTAGELIGGLTYVLSGLQPALRTVITGIGSSGLRFVVTLERILDAGSVAPLRASAAGVRPGDGHGNDRSHGVDLRAVTFAYGPASEPVLRNLDLTVPEGDHLAIVGPSGIGKSTLAALVCGLRRPDAGQVLLGGVPVWNLNPESLATFRVLIPQEAYVFSGTVRDNLVYLRPDATADQVSAAVDAIGARALLARLGGVDGVVAPGELSAGERQLLALVRAYLSPAPLAVLDEATCHLDPVAERRAEEAFAARGGTLIVIAHRISSALRARRVLVLDGAQAIAGDHPTLLATSPLYRELLGHWDALPSAAQIQPAS